MPENKKVFDIFIKNSENENHCLYKKNGANILGENNIDKFLYFYI